MPEEPYILSNSKSDTFGINIRAWCKEHEKYIEDHKDNMNPNKLLRRHEEKLRFLQHERLVHLIVTVMCVGIELFAIGLMFFLPYGNAYAAAFTLLFLILVGFYLRHYFFLENTVQHWYRISDELHQMIDERELEKKKSKKKLDKDI